MLAEMLALGDVESETLAEMLALGDSEADGL